MKKSVFKRGTALALAMVMCLMAFLGSGPLTAHAAGEKAEVFMIGFPRDGEANFNGWGHPELHYMNGWVTPKSNYTNIRAMNSYEGNICYCIEPGIVQNTGDSFTSWDENFWDNFPEELNSTITGDEIKTFIGRILQYGYTGPVSLSWRSQNEGGDKLAQAVATQLLIWETIVGERDSDFGKVDPGSYDEVLDCVTTEHPLYDRIHSYYDSISANVQKHSKLPSFFAKSTSKAQEIEMEWTGSEYEAEITDSNGVLSNYSITANVTGIEFSVDGSTLRITAKEAPTEAVTITASKKNSQRMGVITWTDGEYGPNSTSQDTVTYAQSVSDPVKGYLKLAVSFGSAKIVKTSEDGVVEGISFTITGEGVNQTVVTDKNGEFQIDNLAPGVYTVTEQTYDKYEPQETQRVTVVSGQVATVTFNNTLKRGDLAVYKNAEDGLNEGITFHLYGTSLSGHAVDEYAVTDSDGIAYFDDVLIGSSYTLEEVDTATKYVIPDDQTAAIEWNTVTNKSFTNILKKWNVTVTKSDASTGTAQGGGSLAGAEYGVYKGDQLIDTYCYIRQWLEGHMKRAEKGIRFITPDYKELFRIADGDKVRIITKGGEKREMTCYYIDDYHLETTSDRGRNLYHICEFAERMESNECLSIIPLRKSLPEQCFSFLESTGEIIQIHKGERGYTPTGKFAESGTPREGVNALNKAIGVTRAQEEAMVVGSMFGWDKPGADPARYGEDGIPLTKRQRESGDAR